MNLVTNPSINSNFKMNMTYKYKSIENESNEFKILWSVDKSDLMKFPGGNILSSVILSTKEYGDFNITCSVTHLSSKTILSLSKIIHVPKPPTGGSCNVNPKIGITYFSNFTFIASGWIPENISDKLYYRYGYVDKNNKTILFNNDIDMSSIFVTSKIPVTKKLSCRIYSNDDTFAEMIVDVDITIPSVPVYNYDDILTIDENLPENAIDVIN
jgi:hypothetical protein